jgi:hypothetical protein
MVGGQRDNWKFIFMVVCWNLWTCKNKTIFKEDFQHLIQVFIKMTIEIDSCEKKYSTRWTHPWYTVFICWKFPAEGWIKLNGDGAHNESTNLASCGGLLRDTNDKHLKGFGRRDAGNVYWHGFGLEIKDFSPNSGEWFHSVGRHGNGDLQHQLKHTRFD